MVEVLIRSGGDYWNTLEHWTLFNLINHRCIALVNNLSPCLAMTHCVFSLLLPRYFYASDALHRISFSSFASVSFNQKFAVASVDRNYITFNHYIMIIIQMYYLILYILLTILMILIHLCWCLFKYDFKMLPFMPSTISTIMP